jgi:hypothetical protein
MEFLPRWAWLLRLFIFILLENLKFLDATGEVDYLVFVDIR